MEDNIVSRSLASEDLEFFKDLHNRSFDFTVNSSKILREAARLGKTQVVALIAPWSDPTVQHNEPLVLAAQNGHASTVATLIPYSSAVLRALIRASTQDHQECIKILVQHIDPNSSALTQTIDHLLSAQCLEAVELLIPKIDVQAIYNQLSDRNAEIFEQVRAAREKKLMYAQLTQTTFERKISKM